MLFQGPWATVHKLDERYPARNFALAASFDPSSLVFVAARKEFGPRIAGEVGYQDDEGSGDASTCLFELPIDMLISFNGKLTMYGDSSPDKSGS